MKNKYGLTAAISLSVVVSMIIGGAFLAGYASWTIFEQKQRDTWAIMFLELERRADDLSQKVNSFRSVKNGASLSLYRVDSKAGQLNLVHGTDSGELVLADFGLKKPVLKTNWTLLQRAGETYLADILSADRASALVEKDLSDGQYLALWPLDFTKWISANIPPDSTVYVITRQGALLYSNQSFINAGNVVSRRLVQKFIKNPVSQGQFEFQNNWGRDTYGFIQEIPRTNVVIFSETSVIAAYADVMRILWRFGFVLGGALMISLLVIYIPISKVVNTITRLTRHAKLVAAGEFSGNELKSGFGELGVLTTAFNQMRKNLQQRDKAIGELIEEQKHKVRLEGEVEIAKTIQRNLLSDAPIPEKANVTLSTLYIPAEECAGDWYTYFYDEENNEMISIIADVSGHGTGSSMFTAIIAGITEQMRARPGRFDIDTYLQGLNAVLGTLGKKKWHATMLVARFLPKTSELELVNCGQSSPCVVYPEDSPHKSGMVRLPSMVLGVDEKCQFIRKIVPFLPGTQLLMYTDGLEEARSHAGRQFGRKRIQKICLSAADSPKQQIGRLHSEWSAHLGDGAANDDMCLLVMRAA